MTICEALQNTITAFYEANGQKSKLVKTDVVAINDKEIGVNADGYFDLEEMDISTGDKDNLRTKLLDCLKIHFKLDRKKDLPNNFYTNHKAPKWYKFLQWDLQLSSYTVSHIEKPLIKIIQIRSILYKCTK